MKSGITLFLSCILLSLSGFSQNADSLILNYLENSPFCYSDGKKPKGIEAEIIEEYVNWLKTKKNITVVVTYNPFKEFDAFYTSTKTGSTKTMGMGSVTNNAAREKEILFSAPYLRNVALLITHGSVPTIKYKTKEDISKTLNGLSALTVNASSHAAYLNELKRNYLPLLKINFEESQAKLLETIASNNKVFGYADIIAYWSYLKNNTTSYLKIQKSFSETKEYFSFIMPKNSVHAALINEFFESGFGFTSTKTYHQILEKYLGYEILGSVEIN